MYVFSEVFAFLQGSLVSIKAPKAQPPLAKQRLVHSWIQKSGTAHSFKELEKALPSVASISGMQVKDFLQALADEGKINVEKIGSGNWYWSFPSEDKKAKQKILDEVTAEHEKLVKSNADLSQRIDEAGRARADKDMERPRLTDEIHRLDSRTALLEADLAIYRDNDPTDVLNKRAALLDIKAKLEMVTDDIHIMEDYLMNECGADRESVRELQQDLYGEEYADGEGLAELDL
ncbi:MAG: hypothetical protein M1814_003150 [Vezdaea aestivalis]|nr:MAG: hypothetical protein M1814_003150 [Vezdaea aestivalis]